MVDVERAVEHLQEHIGRLRHDVSMLSAQLEVVRSHIQTKQDLIDDLRVLQADAKVALARTESLEHRAEQAEHLAQRIESETIHRAELTDWRRIQRRVTYATIIGMALAVALTLWVIILHAHDDDTLRQQQQETKQSLCGLLHVAQDFTLSPAARAFAAEATKLSITYGCK